LDTVVFSRKKSDTTASLAGATGTSELAVVPVPVLVGVATVPVGTVVVRVVRRITLPVLGSRSSVTSVTCWVGLVWAAAARGNARPRAIMRAERFTAKKMVGGLNGKRKVID
jgi:hypothetical protein